MHTARITPQPVIMGCPRLGASGTPSVKKTRQHEEKKRGKRRRTGDFHPAVLHAPWARTENERRAGEWPMSTSGLRARPLPAEGLPDNSAAASRCTGSGEVDLLPTTMPPGRRGARVSPEALGHLPRSSGCERQPPAGREVDRLDVTIFQSAHSRAVVSALSHGSGVQSAHNPHLCPVVLSVFCPIQEAKQRDVEMFRRQRSLEAVNSIQRDLN